MQAYILRKEKECRPMKKKVGRGKMHALIWKQALREDMNFYIDWFVCVCVFVCKYVYVLECVCVCLFYVVEWR